MPVAIHLWNRRPGREVAVGSLRWLAAGANRRLRNLKAEQLWLLLLRAALLAVLAVAVAGPVWRRALPASRGQVLLSPEVVGTPAFAALRPTIDSLRRRGFALRWLVAGFPKVSGAAWRANAVGPRDSARLLLATEQAARSFRWARVWQAVGLFPGQPLRVITSAALRQFQGSHTPLPSNVKWQVLPAAAPEMWLQAAAFRADSLRLLLGRSTAAQTAFRLVSVAQPRTGALLRIAGLPALRYETAADNPRLQPISISPDSAAEALLPVPIRTQPLRIVIYSTAEYAADARYLQAALRAAAVGLPVPLALSATATPPNPATSPDWLFWLTDAPLPAEWRGAVTKGTHVWQEAIGPGVATKATLTLDAAAETSVTVLRRSPRQQDSVATAAGFTLWADGLGRAVLTRRGLGQGAFYQLHTRLNSAWSELADSPALPARLLTLLQPELTNAAAPPATPLDQALASYDQRALDPAQLQTGSNLAVGRSSAKAVASATPPAFRLTDLRPWLVLVAGVLFCLERLLARRREARISSAIS